MATCLTLRKAFDYKLLTRSFSSLSVEEFAHFAYISDIELTQKININDKKALQDLLSKHSMILFNQQLTKATQLADLAKVFSPRLQLFGETLNEIQMYIVENRSKELLGSDLWHSDLSYHPIPSYCTLLYAMEVPNESNQGNTQFINMEKRYDALPDTLKAYYSTLKGVHRKYESKKSETIRNDKDTTHPLIRVHPIKGSKVIFANPAYTHKVIDGETGNDLEQSGEILEEIFYHCLSSKFVFEHEWNAGDLLIWDNISLLHKATTLAMDPKFKRVMLRCCTLCN